MADVTDDGLHVHLPCARCGLVEAERNGLCPECATELSPPDSGTAAVNANGQGPDPETAKLER